MNGLKRFCFVSMLWFSQSLFSQSGKEAAEHAARRQMPTFLDFLFQPKFIVMLAIGAVVLVLLLSQKMKKGIKVPILLLSTFLFGIAGNIPGRFFSSFAMHPSPMCAATKPLLYGFGIPFIVTLAVIFLLTLVGPKLFCGYVCPVGAVQELLAMLADKLKIKRGRFNFRISHGVRLGIFLVFIFISATAILFIIFQGKIYPKSLYDYLNPFHGLEFGTSPDLMGYIIHYLPFILTVILSLKYYRPFCHFVCPIGLYTHWLEQMALFRVSYRESRCNDCRACVKASPCTAIPDILNDSTLRPDCYSCNVCVETCPPPAPGDQTKPALTFGIKPTVKD